MSPTSSPIVKRSSRSGLSVISATAIMRATPIPLSAQSVVPFPFKIPFSSITVTPSVSQSWGSLDTQTMSMCDWRHKVSIFELRFSNFDVALTRRFQIVSSSYSQLWDFAHDMSHFLTFSSWWDFRGIRDNSLKYVSVLSNKLIRLILFILSELQASILARRENSV